MIREGASTIRVPLSLSALALLGVLAAAPPPLAAQTVSPAPPSASSASSTSIARLQEQVAQILGDPAVSQASIGVEIRSLQLGDVLTSVNAHKLMMPASVAKVVTLAVAADRLGWDYPFTTNAVGLGTIENGVLRGSLLIEGGGDPTIDDWDGAADARFATLAETLKEKGITSIAGDIVGDDNFFGEGGLGRGWAWDDLGSSYATSVSGLQFNQGTAQLVITPGRTAGASPRIDVRPASAPVLVRNLSTTTSGAGVSLDIRSAERSNAIEVHGSIGRTSGRIVRNVSVSNPTLYFVQALRVSLIKHGITVTGAAVDIDDLNTPPDRTRTIPLGTIATNRLADVAKAMMKVSQNLYAETIFRTIGRQSGARDAEASARIVTDVLSSWGIPESEHLLVDGSGLSRYNLITPAALVSTLAHVYQDPRLRDVYIDTLPLAGVDGTLGRRMHETPAAGNVQAKTGSFLNARAVAGFVRSHDGEPLVFAIVANNYNIETSVIDALSDRILVRLSEFSR